jgi:hypothetical protein
VLPVLSGVADDAVERDPPVHRIHEHVKFIQDPGEDFPPIIITVIPTPRGGGRSMSFSGKHT